MQHAPGLAERGIAVRPRRVERWFYIGVGVFMIVLSIAGFGPSLVAPSTRTVPLPLTPLVMLHAFLAAAWVLIFLVQVTLVATRRRDVHRKLGVVAAVVAAGFVVSGCLSSIEEARRGFDLSGDIVPRGTSVSAGDGLVLINQFVLFGVLVGAAMWYRTRSAVHKRLLLLATLAVMSGAPIAHLAGHWPMLRPISAQVGGIVGLLLLFPGPIYDRLTMGRVHPVSRWGGVFVFVWTLVFFILIPPSAAWHEFAAWLVR